MTRYFPPLAHLSVPNLMTTGSILLGTATLWLVAAGRPRAAAVLFLMVVLSDRLDGVVARLLKQTSEFGRELDSLADLLNFCALPCLAGWILGLRAWWQVAPMVAFLLAGAWRLAYYNLHELDLVGGKPCFVGLCTTHASAILLGVTCLAAIARLPLDVVVPAATVLLSVLMVSSLRVRKNGALVYALWAVVPASVVATFWLR